MRWRFLFLVSLLTYLFHKDLDWPLLNSFITSLIICSVLFALLSSKKKKATFYRKRKEVYELLKVFCYDEEEAKVVYESIKNDKREVKKAYELLTRLKNEEESPEDIRAFIELLEKAQKKRQQKIGQL